jgi:hypothetical protein
MYEILARDSKAISLASVPFFIHTAEDDFKIFQGHISALKL